MTNKFICYIDESGDEGFTDRSSKMFGFSAVIVRIENDIKLPQVQKDILQKISTNNTKPLKNIHFSKLTHEQRKYIVEKIKEDKIPIRTILVLTDKRQIEKKLKEDFNKEKWKLFNYMTKHLLERISWIIRDNRRQKTDQVKIIFSNRKQMKLDKMIKYINNLQKDKDSRIDWSCIDLNVEILNHDQRAGLQFADIFATACRRYAIEGDRYCVETSYLKNLKDFLYKNGKIEGYGLKIRGKIKKELFHNETMEMLIDFGFKMVSP